MIITFQLCIQCMVVINRKILKSVLELLYSVLQLPNGREENIFGGIFLIVVYLSKKI